MVLELCSELSHQGYTLFFDNFYISSKLIDDLKKMNILACGTVNKTRKGFPKDFKDTSVEWGKRASRGNMRWQRDNDIVILEWKDNKLITFCHQFIQPQTSVIAYV